MSNIILFGANGNIGSYIYDQFKDIYEITAVSKRKSNRNIFSINLDLLDNYQLSSFAKHHQAFNCLIFLVGLAHKKGKSKRFNDFKEVNYQTLVNLLSELDKNNILPEKIIFSSTISVYGEKQHQSSYPEESKKTPFSPYAITKLEAEQYLIDTFPEKTWILRFAPVYSKDFRINIERRSKIGSQFYRVGKGNSELSLCNIKNICITINAIMNGKVPPGDYNISDNIDYTYNDILNNQNANWILPIPRFLVRASYLLGRMIGNIFLQENSIKLLTSNVYPSKKIRSYVSFSSTISDND